MSITHYPPISAPTLDQEILKGAGVHVRTSHYKTLDFSPAFIAIYGRPTIVYRPWARLWEIPTSFILETITPKYPSLSSNFLTFAKYEARYAEFCMEVDSYYGGVEGGKGGGNKKDGKIKGAKPVGRSEMEGAWIKMLVGLFEEMRANKDVLRSFVGTRARKATWEKEGRLLTSIRDVEEQMREFLKLAVGQRFSRDAEEYWARKGKANKSRYPDLDVKLITDWSVEKPFQKSLLHTEDTKDNDYDKTDDINEDEIEGKINYSDEVMEGVKGTQVPAPNSKQETQEMKPKQTQEMKHNSVQETKQKSAQKKKQDQHQDTKQEPIQQKKQKQAQETKQEPVQNTKPKPIQETKQKPAQKRKQDQGQEIEQEPTQQKKQNAISETKPRPIPETKPKQIQKRKQALLQETKKPSTLETKAQQTQGTKRKSMEEIEQKPTPQKKQKVVQEPKPKPKQTQEPEPKPKPKPKPIQVAKPKPAKKSKQNTKKETKQTPTQEKKQDQEVTSETLGDAIVRKEKMKMKNEMRSGEVDGMQISEVFGE